MNDIYVINNLENYASILRSDASESLRYTNNSTTLDTTNLDDFISLQQIYQLIDGYSLGQDDEGQYLIDSECHNNIIEDIRNWIFNVGLAKLAASGHIECAWDNDCNEMIFWIPNSMVNDGRSKSDKPNKRPKRKNR